MPTVNEMLAQIWAHHQQGNVVGAEAAYRVLAEKAPENANVHVYLGIALFDLRRYEEAVAAYRRAIEIQPFFPVAHNNLGNALRMIGQVEQADHALALALEQKPDYLNAMKNRGTLWVWDGQIDRGLRWYQAAIALQGDDAEVRRNLGIIYLLQGRYEEGWREYRYRWKLPGLVRPAFTKPVWQGEPLAGKTLFVYPEQGLGDAIQFLRILPRVRDMGGTVIVGCETKLVPLFSLVEGMGQIVPTGTSGGPFDYHASLVEVADYTWQGLQSIDGKPYLHVAENLREYWRNRLASLPGLKVGICWQGNREHHADIYRSIPLATFEPLAQLPGVSLVSLQFGEGTDQLARVPFAPRIHRLPEDVDRSGGAFLDTAAIVANLDLIITVDTSTGHLAGAIGTPTWLLLGKVPDWRWGLQSDRTPWYQNHRLWRQVTQGDWQPLIAEVAHALGKVS